MVLSNKNIHSGFIRFLFSHERLENQKDKKLVKRGARKPLVNYIYSLTSHFPFFLRWMGGRGGGGYRAGVVKKGPLFSHLWKWKLRNYNSFEYIPSDVVIQ